MIAKTAKEQIGKGSLIRKMFEEGKRLADIYGAENVYDFSLGNPDLEPPAEVIAALQEDAASKEKGLHGYMANNGYEESRRRVAAYESERADVEIAADGVLMTVGAACAINVALRSLCDPGDEVIVIKPYFTEYKQYVRLAGAELLEADCDENFLPDFASLEEKIGAKTKVIIINSPNNPSGAVYSAEILDRLETLLQKQDHCIYVLSDEPYREIAYGAEVPPVLKHIKNALIAYSWSKSFALPGERIGYLCFPKHIADYEDLSRAAVLYLRTLGFVNAPAIWQRVVTRCIDLPVSCDIYQRRRDKFLKILENCGFSCRRPEGAFYLFPKVPSGISEDEFASILAKHHILSVPGSAFGLEGYVRLSYAVKDEVIERSAAAFAEAAREIKSLRR